MTMLDDSHLTDPGLVAEVRLGRREAFGELYRRYYSGALRYALSMTRGDETRAQDIVSEAFTRVFRAVSRNGNVLDFWPYLLASVRNAHRAELRRSGRVDLVERAADLDGLLPAAPAEAGQDDPGVRAAFRRLPPRWQSVLWRSAICGDTAAEIGSDLGISANAAAALAFRAREGLRVEYLRGHFTNGRTECRPYAEQLARLVRGMLGRRDRRRVEAHVRICAECSRALTDLTALNGRMRSVLPLILGVVPFASGQGLSSAPTGAVGSGLVGSAGIASGAATTASVTGGAAGAAGAAGLGAAGMTHVSAVAGIAVASMLAVLGLQAEPTAGDPAESPPVETAVAPLDEPAVSLVPPVGDGSEPAPGEEDPASEGLLAASGTATAPSDAAAPDGEAGLVSGDEQMAGTSAEGASDPAEAIPGSESAAGGDPAVGGVTDGWQQPVPPGEPGYPGDGGPESAGGQPFSAGGPPGSPGQGATDGPWDGDVPGRGRPDSGGQPDNDAPGGSGKPERAAEPPREGPAKPARPSQAAEPARPGPATPERPSQAAEPSRNTPDADGKPSKRADSTPPGRSRRHLRGRFA